MSLAQIGLLSLPSLVLRQIIEEVIVLSPIDFKPSYAVYLRRVCSEWFQLPVALRLLTKLELFDEEICAVMFNLESARIQRHRMPSTNMPVAVTNRKILERVQKGTLERSSLTRAIFGVAAQLREERRKFPVHSDVEVFELVFGVAAAHLTHVLAFKRLFETHSTPSSSNDSTDSFAVAAFLGMNDWVRRLLDAGAHINRASDCFDLPLTAAAYSGKTETVRLLLDTGANPNQTSAETSINGLSSSRKTALIVACTKGHEPIIRLLLNPKYGLETYGSNYNRCLHALVKGCHADLAMLLLKAGTFEDVDRTHHEIFLKACYSGCLPLIRMMVDEGYDVNADVFGQWRPIEYAAYGGHDSIVSLLLENGAEFESQALSDDVINLAAQKGHVGTVKILLDHGANVDSTTYRQGNTPLFHAATGNHAQLVRFLLERGASLAFQKSGSRRINNPGYGGLKYAIERNFQDVACALLDAGVPVNEIPKEFEDQDAPLIVSAKMYSQHRMVALLLERGADDVDPMDTKWADAFRNGTYPKSSTSLQVHDLR